MNKSKFLINVMAKLKPYLIKVIPLSFLSKMKKRYMMRNVKNLKNEKIIPYDENAFPMGINLIGNIRGDSGLGQSCRLVAKELAASNIPFMVYEHHISEAFSMTNHTCDEYIEDKIKYGINLFHINPHEFAVSYMQLGKEVWDRHYNIAFWLWEIEEFPEEWIGCIDILDEIWTPAEFVSESIRKVTNKPVRTIPYHVEAPVEKQYDRGYFKLPEDKFLFLMMYDSKSMMERKNPISVLQAFKQAFNQSNQEVGLVIKMNGRNEKDIEQIQTLMDGYDNIYFLTETLPKIEVNSLIACVDAFVSLHRAEGFGLVMAEAILNGTPCIATNWSANTEFMNADVACMVDYTLVTLNHEVGPYKQGSHWAEPDVVQAAEYMQKLFEDREYGRQMAEKAKAFIEDRLGMEHITKCLGKNVDAIINKK